MWKREQAPDPVAATPAEGPGPERRAPARTPGERATIGRSITIRGEVTGDEDLLIQGRVDGSVHLKQHAITVGPEGEVKADIIGRVVTVEGSVQGNLRAEEQVVLRTSARVEGDIAAPRVMLEDGAYFRGGVDMGESLDRTVQSAGAPRSSSLRTPEPVRSPSPGLESSPRDNLAGPRSSSDDDKAESADKGKGTPQTSAQVTT